MGSESASPEQLPGRPGYGGFRVSDKGQDGGMNAKGPGKSEVPAPIFTKRAAFDALKARIHTAMLEGR